MCYNRKRRVGKYALQPLKLVQARPRALEPLGHVVRCVLLSLLPNASAAQHNRSRARESVFASSSLLFRCVLLS